MTITKISATEVQELVDGFVAENPEATEEELQEALDQFFEENELEPEETEVEVENDDEELITELVGTAIADQPDEFMSKFSEAIKPIITALVDMKRLQVQNEFLGVETPEVTEEEAEASVAEAADAFIAFVEENDIAEEDIEEAFAAFVEENELDEDEQEILATFLEALAEEEAVDEAKKDEPKLKPWDKKIDKEENKGKKK